MAYWIPVNGIALSNWTVTKNIQASNGCNATVLIYDINFSASAAERYNPFGQFEVLTAYLKPIFSQAWTIDLKLTNNITPLSVQNREQKYPLIFSTQDQKYAMGIYNPRLPQSNFENDGYGAWHFLTDPPGCPETMCKDFESVKLNTVERFYPAGTNRSFRVYIFLGTRETVADEMIKRYKAGQLN